LMGSTAIPILFPPVEHMFDGGVLLNQPLNPAIVLGEALDVYNYFVVIPASERLGSTENMLEIVQTLLNTWLSRSLIYQVENIELENKINVALSEPKVNVCIIRPQEDITTSYGVTALSFGKNVGEMVSDGIHAANSCLDSLGLT
ncbi:MAG: hypothetical protein ACT4O2_14235, partial [Beijerinckiaceae bacterium]